MKCIKALRERRKAAKTEWAYDVEFSQDGEIFTSSHTCISHSSCGACDVLDAIVAYQMKKGREDIFIRNLRRI